jgi:hypothetical protein
MQQRRRLSQLGHSHDRKEVKQMKYEKPEIALLDQAITAIQNTLKSGPDIDTRPSDAAYRSDE